MYTGWSWRLGIFCGCGVAPLDVIRQISFFKKYGCRAWCWSWAQMLTHIKGKAAADKSNRMGLKQNRPACCGPAVVDRLVRTRWLKLSLAAGLEHFAWTRWPVPASRWTLAAGSGFWPGLWFPKQNLHPRYRL